MRCNRCGSDDSIRMRIIYDTETNRTHEICDRCGFRTSVCIPDTYFRTPYFDENLADEQHTHGQFIESKRHKAQIMRQLGIREAGDRIHGSRNQEFKHYGEKNKFR